MGIRQGPAKHRILHSKLIMEEEKIISKVSIKITPHFGKSIKYWKGNSYALNVMCRRSKTCWSEYNTEELELMKTL